MKGFFNFHSSVLKADGEYSSRRWISVLAFYMLCAAFVVSIWMPVNMEIVYVFASLSGGTTIAGEISKVFMAGKKDNA